MRPSGRGPNPLGLLFPSEGEEMPGTSLCTQKKGRRNPGSRCSLCREERPHQKPPLMAP